MTDSVVGMTTSTDSITEINIDSVQQILKEEYLGIGAIGADAIVSMWSDFSEALQTEWSLENGVTEEELALKLAELTLAIVRDGKVRKMNTPIGWVVVE